MPVSSNLCVTALSYVQFIFKPNFVLGGEQSSTLSLLSAQVKPDYQKSGERNNDHCIPGSSSRLCSVNAQAFECFQFYYYCKARGGSGPARREQFLFTAS